MSTEPTDASTLRLDEPVAHMPLADSAHRIGSYRWVENRLFQIVGGWVVDSNDAAVKVHFSALSHHFAEHASWLSDRLPHLGDLTPESVTTAPSIASFIESLDGEQADATRLVALHDVVVPYLLETYNAHISAGSTVAEASISRSLRLIIEDLRFDNSEGLRLLDSVLRDPASRQHAAEHSAHLRAELALAEAADS